MAHLGVTQKVSCIDLTNIWWLIGLSARKKNSNIIPDPAEVIHHQGWFYTYLLGHKPCSALCDSEVNKHGSVETMQFTYATVEKGP